MKKRTAQEIRQERQRLKRLENLDWNDPDEIAKELVRSVNESQETQQKSPTLKGGTKSKSLNELASRTDSKPTTYQE